MVCIRNIVCDCYYFEYYISLNDTVIGVAAQHRVHPTACPPPLRFGGPVKLDERCCARRGNAGAIRKASCYYGHVALPTPAAGTLTPSGDLWQGASGRTPLDAQLEKDGKKGITQINSPNFNRED